MISTHLYVCINEIIAFVEIVFIESLGSPRVNRWDHLWQNVAAIVDTRWSSVIFRPPSFTISQIMAVTTNDTRPFMSTRVINSHFKDFSKTREYFFFFFYNMYVLLYLLLIIKY